MRQKVCKKSAENGMQKRSFCTAIPIVLRCKGCRIARRIVRIYDAKAVGLVQNRMDFAEKRLSKRASKVEKWRFKGLIFSRMNFLVEVFRGRK